jgi:hypothetical protein
MDGRGQTPPHRRWSSINAFASGISGWDAMPIVEKHDRRRDPLRAVNCHCLSFPLGGDVFVDDGARPPSRVSTPFRAALRYSLRDSGCGAPKLPIADNGRACGPRAIRSRDSTSKQDWPALDATLVGPRNNVTTDQSAVRDALSLSPSDAT